MKKFIAKFVFKLIKPYIKVAKYESDYDLYIVFVLTIFGVPLHRVQISKEKMVRQTSFAGVVSYVPYAFLGGNVIWPPNNADNVDDVVKLNESYYE